MAMQPSSPSGLPVINVTPLIDVLLVLLIIFMVITPLRPVGLSARIPQSAELGETRPSQPAPIVVKALGDGRATVNQMEVPVEELARFLDPIYRAQPNATIFIDGMPWLDFRQVAEIIDISKGVGWSQFGLLMTTK